MIRLHRGPEPQFLKDNKAEWSVRFSSDPAPADWATDSAKQQIKAALMQISLGKCSYCEGRPDETGYSEIEHYHPKSIYTDLVFEWTNLLLSCHRCNGTKLNFDHNGALLKPDEDDPEDLLWLNLDSGMLEAQDALDLRQKNRVEETIRICGLNRGELCSARLKVWEATKRTLIRVAYEASNLTAETRADMLELLSPMQVYKFAVRFALARDNEEELLQKDRGDFEAASRPS